MNTDNKALVILTPGFPESEADTTCLPLQQNLVLALKKNHPDQQLIVLSFQYPYHRVTYTWKGVQVISFNGRNRPGVTRLLTRRRVNVAMGKIKERYQITGLISFWYGECAWVGKKFADKFRLKHFVWILGQDARDGNRYPRITKAGSTELVALSDFIQDEFERNYHIRPAHIIAPGIDPEQFATPPSIKDIDIIGVGSLIPLKQFDVFIELIAGLKEKIPSIKVMLIGEGPERKKLEYLINEQSLQQTISLTGELPHEQVLLLMQRSKILMHTSSYEGFGCVCAEALYARARVMSFCRPMKADIEQWHIVTDRNEMKEKALDLLLNPSTQYKSIKVYNIDEVAEKFRQLFAK